MGPCIQGVRILTDNANSVLKHDTNNNDNKKNIQIYFYVSLTHWGRVTHICVNKLTIIGSDNGLVPGRHQTIIWTNAGILLIGPLGTNFSEILIQIQTFSFKKMHLKISSAKRRPFCLGLNVLDKLSTARTNDCTKRSGKGNHFL